MTFINTSSTNTSTRMFSPFWNVPSKVLSLTKNSEIDSPTKILFSTFSMRAVAPEVSAVTFLLVKIVLLRAVLYRTLTAALFAGAVLNIIF